MLTPQQLDTFVRDEDRYGSGAFHAARTTGDTKRLHEGIDLLFAPGTPLYAWEPLHFIRVAIPYADGIDADVLKGVLLRRPDTSNGVEEFKLLYVEPAPIALGTLLHVGEHFGIVQSLQNRYPGIQNHSHFEAWSGGTRIDPSSVVAAGYETMTNAPLSPTEMA